MWRGWEEVVQVGRCGGGWEEATGQGKGRPARAAARVTAAVLCRGAGFLSAETELPMIYVPDLVKGTLGLMQAREMGGSTHGQTHKVREPQPVSSHHPPAPAYLMCRRRRRA